MLPLAFGEVRRVGDWVERWVRRAVWFVSEGLWERRGEEGEPEWPFAAA